MFQTKAVWSGGGGQTMVKLIFEKINFSRSRDDHRHFFKWNYMIFFTYNISSYFAYKSIKIVIKKSIMRYVIPYFGIFDVKYKICRKLFIFFMNVP